MTIDSHDTREIVLRTDMPFELPPPPFDDFIPIGSETRHGQRTQYIVVDGVPLHQADLFMHILALLGKFLAAGFPLHLELTPHRT